MATKLQRTFPPRMFLAKHRQDELDALFAALPATGCVELRGSYQGTLIGVGGLDWLPGIAKAVIYRLLTTWLSPWRGKYFDGAEGVNLWGFGALQGGWGKYRLQDRPDTTLALDYDVAANPAFLRPILGEVRCFQPGLYLARMRYRTPNGIRTLLYFTLQEAH